MNSRKIKNESLSRAIKFVKRRSPTHTTEQPEAQSAQKRKSPEDSTSQDQIDSKPKIKRIRLILPATSEGKPVSRDESPGLGSAQATDQPLALSTPRTERQHHVPEHSSDLSDLKVLGAVGDDRETPTDGQDHISFGTLRSLGGPKLSIFLSAPANGSCRTKARVGSHPSCGVMVPGDDVGKHHCNITLELWQNDHLPLWRRVRVQRIDPLRPIHRTLIWKGKGWFQLKESETLSDGDCIQFGDGPQFKYESAKLDDLYKRQNHLYGDHETNSSVLRVHRLGDGAEFVAKVIDKEHITMALKELDAFKILGYHPYITQFVESFYDKLEGIHHIVLEPAQMDLLTHVSRMRPHKQRTLASQARQITAQASSAIGHIHSYQIAHRDIKPENLLISVAESGDINLRVCDFGLARVKSQPVSEKEWFTGTPDWMAPASFRTYTSDDRLVDCYGIGRVLYYLLSSCPWPSESEDAEVLCDCDEPCPSTCVRRTAAFNTIINAGIDKTCLSFLQNLLVDDPDKCMDIRELLQHPYLMEAVSKLAT